jgi:integrative and conjugative element protein (TIGR02256 family)
MKRYPIGQSNQSIVLSTRVLDHFTGHRQLHFWNKEAGGLLFARLLAAEIVIELATGPRPTDRRRRHSFWPDRKAEQREIDKCHMVGLHFVGTWHTHPEDNPAPSLVDLRSIRDIFCRSQHSLNGFVMAIIGCGLSTDGVYIGIWDGSTLLRLEESPVSEGCAALCRSV